MRIFAIADLHLSFLGALHVDNWDKNQEYKPMVELDKAWHNHARRIYENWHRLVKEDDLVLVPGDISWAMRLDEAGPDFDYLGLLPGRLVCVQGNHDYWWQSISRAREAVPSNVQLIQNDHVKLEGVNICGTRGWLCPNGAYFKEEDEKIYRRELIRLENSLQSVDNGPKIVVMHYMPTNEKHDYSGFIELFQKYEVKTVIYGHLHAKACRYRLPDQAWGINFHLTSADYLNFTPRLITSC
ncbi:metallophosphoesterase [Desulfoscipio gibsoniae]|uniref:Putative phosphohydrolase n=1 Tax=Desulfoscipio gibsoniae DSM 7213 TaxID=767817 RepID=R4KPX5_9FIRM|nr:metallophosphoesterase [Desulfoscipio gibsoniae]AGL02620.1 putative phosphohydrolase [Desulfoscipio gibsoniae DSM 7213]